MENQGNTQFQEEFVVLEVDKSVGLRGRQERSMTSASIYKGEV
jgi:hypothetical protein